MPGVVLLDEVAVAVARWRTGARLRRIVSVKFLRPVLPNNELEITLAEIDGGDVHFVCCVSEIKVVEGRCEI